MHSHVHSGKDENRKQTQKQTGVNERAVASELREQAVASELREEQLPPSYEREQLETATKRVKTIHRKNDTHPKRQQRTDENTQKGDVNRKQHRSSDKSHGTMGRQ